MKTSSLLLPLALIVGLFDGSPRAQEPAGANVAEILDRHDRALIQDLGAYLRKNPRADDRDQAYASLFNKAIEHDWFKDSEDLALGYLKSDPDGPVKALAQIIATMSRAGAGQFDQALARYRDLMSGLGKSDQEDFAISFSDTFASAAMTSGEFDTARKVYQTLAERFSDSATVREKAAKELARLDRVGKTVTEAEAQDLDGKPVRLESLKGKYVLVDFWATWCAPCIAELPRLQEAHRKYGPAGFEIVAVSLDETRVPVVDFAKTRKLPWIQIHNGSSGADLVEAFGVSSIPASYLLDPDGRIIRLDLRGQALDATLAKLIKPTTK